MVFQDYALFPWLTVERNIGFGLEVKGVPETERARIVAEHVKLVGLAGFETRLPHQLSGGMKQRVAIARALAVDPQVALLDEPFAALDAQNRGLLQDELVRISLATKKTMVLITHSIEEAIKLSDRIVVMTKRPGTVKAIIDIDLPRPRDPFLLQTTPEFIEIYHRVWELLRDDIRKSEAA